jgi:hypothetical protein
MIMLLASLYCCHAREVAQGRVWLVLYYIATANINNQSQQSNPYHGPSWPPQTALIVTIYGMKTEDKNMFKYIL